MSNFFINYEELENDVPDNTDKIFRTEGSFVVNGCAGSRKLIIALTKAKRINDYRNGTFIFISKTKIYKQYILDNIVQYQIPLNSIETFNKCFNWNKLYDEWQRLDWKKGTIDYIFVFEAELFSKEDLILLKNKVSKAIYIFGDWGNNLQAEMYFKKVDLKDLLISTGLPLIKLHFDYRLPKKIARFARFISNEDVDIEIKCKNEGSEKPKILGFNSPKEQLEEISRIISVNKLGSVAIFFRDIKSLISAYNYLTSKNIVIETNVEIIPTINPYLSWKSKEVKKYLKEIGMKLNDISKHDQFLSPENVYKELKKKRLDYYKNIQQPLEISFCTDNPKFHFYQKLSDIFFDTIFLPQCELEDPELLFELVTHASQRLYITYSGNLSTLIKNIPSSLYETSIETI